MVDFTKIEVGRLFSGSVVVHEGVQMELRYDMLTMLSQMPELSRDQLQAINKGFKRYSSITDKQLNKERNPWRN